MTIYDVLKTTKLPVVYSHFKTRPTPPYLVYSGSGQHQLSADNTYIWRENEYEVEYYFMEKNEANEKSIEDALLTNGYQYEKSEDLYIDELNLYMIYYYV